MNISNHSVHVANQTTVVDSIAIFGEKRDSLYIVIPITIIYTLIFVTGLFGNILTCLVIIRNKVLHTATNYYLFSLAVSDLLLLISGMPQEMYSIWSKWPYVFGHAFCVMRGLAAETSTNASVLTITLFTIERYLAICHPFVSHKMSKLSRAKKHVVLLWILAFIFALPQAMQFGVGEYNGVVMCLQIRVIIQHSFELSSLLFFLAPMILITVLYILIGMNLKQTSMDKQMSRQESVQFQNDESCGHMNKLRRKPGQSTRRVVKMLVAVVVVFFICWAPFHAQRLVAIYGASEKHLPRTRYPLIEIIYNFLTYTSGVFYYMSTCINPLFYHIMSNKFRAAFKNTFKKWCCQNSKINTRGSYNGIGFARNLTTSAPEKSGNSLNKKQQIEKKNSSEAVLVPKQHICDVCAKKALAKSTQKFSEQATSKKSTSNSRGSATIETDAQEALNCNKNKINIIEIHVETNSPKMQGVG